MAYDTPKHVAHVMANVTSAPVKVKTAVVDDRMHGRFIDRRPKSFSPRKRESAATLDTPHQIV